MAALSTTDTLRPAVADRIAHILNDVRASFVNYVNYRRTYKQLNALSTDALLDLDLYRGDLKTIARQSVYGR